MKLFKRRFLLILAFGLSLAAYSAPAPPPTGGPGCWPPPCIPIDGGISLLMMAGAAYGAKKFHEARKNKDSSL